MIYPWLQEPLARLMQRPPAQALLLSGPRGIGLSQFARQVAQALFCARPQAQGLGCGTCTPCQWFGAATHPDYRLLEPESAAAPPGVEGASPAGLSDSPRASPGSAWITVDQVRELSDFLVLSTHQQGYRVLVVDPAEALNPNAANALLKVLEEPRPGTVFLLVSHHPARVPATILSRCQSFKLALPPTPVALAWLQAQAVAAPEQLLALAGQAPLEAQRLALQEQGVRTAWLEHLVAGQLTLIQLSEHTAKLPLSDWLDWLQRWVFDLIEFKILGQARYHLALSSSLARMSERLSLFDLLAWEKSLREARRLMHHPLNPRLLAEHLLLPCFSTA